LENESCVHCGAPIQVRETSADDYVRFLRQLTPSIAPHVDISQKSTALRRMGLDEREVQEVEQAAGFASLPFWKQIVLRGGVNTWPTR